MGTPIRLVRNDGGIIELMATTLTMNVDGGVTPLPMPFAGGSRFAFDLNLPKSLITIEGVMTDDDLLNIGGLQREASAVIDFSRIAGQPTDSAFRWNNFITYLVSGMSDGATGDADYAIRLTNTVYVWLVKNSSSNQGLDSGRYYITIHNNTSARSASDIAASLVSLVTTYTGTFNLTANQINSPIDNTANTAVELTQVNQGSAGNTSHPSFSIYPPGIGVHKPYHTQFFGGANSTQVTNKSAGDKVAELFAVLNNSNNGGGGAVLNPFAAGMALGSLTTTGSLERARSLDTKYGDYIIGLQVPFSSNVNNRESLFYMPTGAMMETIDKTADNAPATGVEFDAYDSEFTGIKGTVANATFVQLGGEPLYSYTINFAPIDWIF